MYPDDILIPDNYDFNLRSWFDIAFIVNSSS